MPPSDWLRSNNDMLGTRQALRFLACQGLLCKIHHVFKKEEETSVIEAAGNNYSLPTPRIHSVNRSNQLPYTILENARTHTRSNLDGRVARHPEARTHT